MNDAQRLWWKQAHSDYQLFGHLQRTRANECHLLHYLQMATEKLSKAYFWRSGHAPPKSHLGFVRFLKALLSRRTAELDRIAEILGFSRRQDFERWVPRGQMLAYAVQNLAPAEANNGPNPEYPWPHEAPAHCPCEHSFRLWDQLINTAQGRKFVAFIDRAVSNFDKYA